MVILNEQHNIIEDLRAPIRSFRIFALEEIIKNGKSFEILSSLEQLKLTEEDPECQGLFEHAISAVKQRLSYVGVLPFSLESSSEFLSSWHKADEKQKMRMLLTLPPSLPSQIKNLGWQLLKTESSVIISAKIVRVFCRDFSLEELQTLKIYLEEDSLILSLAVLRTIIHRDPRLLLEDLPTLLSSEDPQIKALAIRALAKIDKEEALKHLQALLLSSHQSDRLVGIQNCLFLPFDMIKPVLLKFFAFENKVGLLMRAGWILKMNPNVQVPFKLYEIAEKSSHQKSALIKTIINDCVLLLQKSGIIKDNFKAYSQELQNWVYKKNALQFTQRMISKLNKDDIPVELDRTIKKALAKQKMILSFKQALNWPIPDKVKENLKKYIKFYENKAQLKETDALSDKKEKITDILEKPDCNTFFALSFEEKISCITSLTIDQYGVSKAIFDKIISSLKERPEITAATFNCLTRLKILGHEDSAIRLVSNSNVELATSAVEYLGFADPEKLFPYIGQCLKVSDVRMKSAALKILKDFDYNQAISFLRVMLLSPTHKQQKMALECLEQFDFSLIREILTDFLIKTKFKDLYELGLCFFAANPSSENVYLLYKVEQAQEEEFAIKAREIRLASPEDESKDIESDNPTEETDSLPDDKQSTPNLPPEREDDLLTAQKEEEKKNRQAQQDIDLAQKYKQEKDQKKKPAYAFDTIKKANVNIREYITALYAIIKQYIAAKGARLVLGVLFVFALLFYYLFSVPKQPERIIESGPMLAAQHLREGTVTNIIGNAVEFSTTNKEIFILQPLSEGYRLPSIGAKLRVSLVPFRKVTENSYSAKIRAMREVETFTLEQSGAE